MLGLLTVLVSITCSAVCVDLRLEGGAAEGFMASSSSLARFRPPGAGRPRFAEDMLGGSGGGELDSGVSI
jgi:hypothetical protein